MQQTLFVLESNQRYSYEMILVNDGSKDDTTRIIMDLCSSNNSIKGVELTKNYGQANATLAGMHHASGDIIVYSDDDGQTPINDLWKLVSELEDGFDVVFGTYVSSRAISFKRIGTFLNDLMATHIIGKPTTIKFSNFWACNSFISKQVIKSNNPSPYIGGLFLDVSCNMSSVNIHYQERKSGKSNYNSFRLMKLWFNGFTASSVQPLRFVSLLGVVFALVGFAITLNTIQQKIFYPNIPVGYASLMASLWIIGGLIMFQLGLLGEYVSRIYLNVTKNQQFTVRNRINLDEFTAEKNTDSIRR